MPRTPEAEFVIESQRPVLEELERYLEWLRDTETGMSAKLAGHVTITIQTRGKKAINGSFTRSRWSTKEGQAVHEINISAERLYDDPYEVLQTLHHEAVHLWNHENGIQDCSKSGSHNKKFLETAIDVFGMEHPGERDTRHGYSHVVYSDATRQQVEAEFKPQLEVFRLFRETEPPKEKAPSKNKKWACACEPSKNVRAAVDLSHIFCEDCETHFYLA